MIKRASGDWQHRIPPWTTTHTCDVRRYRGPYNGIQEELARKGHAVRRLNASFDRARRNGAEFVIIHHGKRSPGREAVHRLMHDLVESAQYAERVNIAESRQYPDRLVVALDKAASPRRFVSFD